MLEDFILQAEIYLQYGMRSKALERLERVSKLFPREEQKNEKLRHLYISAGFTPVYEVAEAAARGHRAGICAQRKKRPLLRRHLLLLPMKKTRLIILPASRRSRGISIARPT